MVIRLWFPLMQWSCGNSPKHLIIHARPPLRHRTDSSSFILHSLLAGVWQTNAPHWRLGVCLHHEHFSACVCSSQCCSCHLAMGPSCSQHSHSFLDSTFTVYLSYLTSPFGTALTKCPRLWNSTSEWPLTSTPPGRTWITGFLSLREKRVIPVMAFIEA